MQNGPKPQNGQSVISVNNNQVEQQHQTLATGYTSQNGHVLNNVPQLHNLPNLQNGYQLQTFGNGQNQESFQSHSNGNKNGPNGHEHQNTDHKSSQVLYTGGQSLPNGQMDQYLQNGLNLETVPQQPGGPKLHIDGHELISIHNSGNPKTSHNESSLESNPPDSSGQQIMSTDNPSIAQNSPNPSKDSQKSEPEDQHQKLNVHNIFGITDESTKETKSVTESKTTPQIATAIYVVTEPTNIDENGEIFDHFYTYSDDPNYYSDESEQYVEANGHVENNASPQNNDQDVLNGPNGPYDQREQNGLNGQNSQSGQNGHIGQNDLNGQYGQKDQNGQNGQNGKNGKNGQNDQNDLNGQYGQKDQNGQNGQNGQNQNGQNDQNDQNGQSGSYGLNDGHNSQNGQNGQNVNGHPHFEQTFDQGSGTNNVQPGDQNKSENQDLGLVIDNSGHPQFVPSVDQSEHENDFGLVIDDLDHPYFEPSLDHGLGTNDQAGSTNQLGTPDVNLNGIPPNLIDDPNQGSGQDFGLVIDDLDHPHLEPSLDHGVPDTTHELGDHENGNSQNEDFGLVIDERGHPYFEPGFDHKAEDIDQNAINLITPTVVSDLYGPQQSLDDPFSGSSSHEYETMNPFIRDDHDGKNPSAEKLNHKPSNADGAQTSTTVKPFNLNPNGDNSPTHFMSTFQGMYYHTALSRSKIHFLKGFFT